MLASSALARACSKGSVSMNRHTVSTGLLAPLALAALCACAPAGSASSAQAPAAESHAPSAMPAAPEVAAAAQPAQAAPATALTRIADPSQVCMVNNTFMGKPQIPVVVNGATYYGCCEMCKGKLAQDPSSRVAVDPVSNRPIDKAVAVMAKDERGAVVYFESEANLTQYSQRSRVN
jgi:YHS domain-containing protein